MFWVGRIVSILIGWVIAQSGAAETLLTYASVKEVSETSITVSTGSAVQTALITDKTHAYRKMAIAKPTEFEPGEKVRVRIKLDGKAPTLREIMDEASEKWIDRIRHEYIRAEVTAIDPSRLTAKLDDETTFVYKITPSTKIDHAGAAITAAGLPIGATVWVKGKGLSNLDTQLAHATDTPPTPKPSSNPTTKPKSSSTENSTKRTPTSNKSRSSKSRSSIGGYSNRLPFTNTADGTVDLVLGSSARLDLKVAGRLTHFEWTPRTQFFIGENRATWQDLTLGLPVSVYFYKDSLGRFILSRVQMP